jgi:hypothetical protein
MSILKDEIARLTAELTPTTKTPRGDLGFGSDLDCANDLTATMAELPGDSPLVVAQANYRAITSPRGSVPDAPGYGFDVPGLLNKGLTTKEVTAIAGQIGSQLRDDDRNENVSVSLTPIGETGDFDLDVSGETAAGPYELIFAIEKGQPLLKKITG